MKPLHVFAAKLSGLFRKRSRERELAAELESHFQMHIEDNIRAGMNPEDARREAILKFGAVESTKEAMRDVTAVVWLETAWQDVRHAVRGFARNPGFATAAILSLVFGLGSSLAIFTVADNLLIRPLPFPHASQLVMVWEGHYGTIRENNIVSPGNYFDWKAQNDVFDAMALFEPARSVLNDDQRSEEILEELATADLLPMLGAHPVRGRLFTPQDDRPGAERVILITYRLWQAWFGGAESVIGQQVRVGGNLCSIIGVLPPQFYFEDRSIEIWQPMRLDLSKDYRKIAGRYVWCIARMRPGVSSRSAQTEMSAIARRLESAYPAFDKGWTVTLEPLRDAMVGKVKTSLLVLLGGVGLLLAVACANVASLMLARYTSQRREMAVRTSLGAGRPRIIRQLLTESVLLGVAGGLLGMLAAKWCVTGLLFLAPKDLTQSVDIAIDFRIYFFAAALSVLTGILFGLAPALVSSRPDPIHALHQDSRSVTGGPSTLRNWFVGAEVALSVMLLAGASLLFRTLVQLQNVNPGLDPHNVLTLRVSLPGARYSHSEQTTEFFARALGRINHLPGIVSESAISHLQFNGMEPATAVAIGGRPRAKPGEELVTTVRTVMPGYFRTMHIAFRAGRDFTAGDNTSTAPLRFIISEAFERKYLRGVNPLDQRIQVEMAEKNPFGEIIGVVGDVRDETLDQAPTPTVYYVHGHLAYDRMVLVVRAAANPLSLVEPIRRIVRSIDPAQPIADVHTMDEILSDTYSRQRFSLLLLSGFSIASLMLAAIGIYGVLAYSVSERTREIGVRVALGAETGSIISLVLGSGARLIACGLSAGIAGALALSGLLRTMLFGVSPRDPLTFAMVPVVLAAVGLMAAYIPARRAAHLNPMDALRAE
jgi:putative ABC transport system permease protein